MLAFAKNSAQMVMPRRPAVSAFSSTDVVDSSMTDR